MSFERPWMLLVALIPLAWLAWEWRKGRQLTSLTLKALGFCAILLALAEPSMVTSESKMAVSVLVDTSESISEEGLKRASAIANQVAKQRGRNWVKVIPFARATRKETPGETANGFQFKHADGEVGRGTNLEGAVREGMAAMPEGLVPKLLLLSDGHENKGSIARASYQAQQMGAPIDTIELAGRPKPQLRLESVIVPGQAYTGDRFPIELIVTAPKKTASTVEVSAEGKTIGTKQAELEPGVNHVRLNVSLNVAGSVDLIGVLRSEGQGELRFARAISLNKPRLLYVSQDPDGSEKHLLGVWSSSQFSIDRASEFSDAKLAGYQMVVFNNTDLEMMSSDKKASVEAYVKHGGGLLVISGERNVYLENKKGEDLLEKALPAKLAPPRSPEGTCVVLIVDKSSSMEGRKMELARLASIGVVENLRQIDYVGVLIFDNSFQWAVPIRKADDRKTIQRLIAGITPDGGTQIAPALNEAYRRALPIKATFKHIVLLTDGISEEGDSMALSKEAAINKVTISTVGLGQDVNRAYLEKVAAYAKGKAYFLNEPAGLEQILLKDVMEHTGSTAIEKNFSPVVQKKAEILEGVGMESAPALKGYVKFEAKPSADLILAVDQKDPLLVRWQYGLGRSAVFASDAKSRWAESWMAWNGFDKFWQNVVRDLLPHAQDAEANLELDPVAGELVATYKIAGNAVEPGKLPELFIFGPDNFRKPVTLFRAAGGLYKSRIAIGERQGLFRMRPLEESKLFPEIGYYRQEAEMNDYESNPDLLKQISSFTGGRFNPTVDQIFQSNGRSVSAVMRWWPGLLALAIALNLAELVIRKVRAIRRERTYNQSKQFQEA